MGSDAIYMDHNATTPIRPEVRAAMAPYMDGAFGNASSIHTFGREAAKGINRAREQVASALDCRPDEVVFTGSGTEADNLAIKGIATVLCERGDHLVTTQVEHHAVLHTCRYLEEQGFSVTYLPVDGYGAVNPDDVWEAITDRTMLISVMHANNEVGAIQPLAEIGAIARERGVLFHTDAVQTFGKLPTRVNELQVDLLSLSAHKIHGPKGIGALYVREGVQLVPLLHGGHHERSRRAGTENVAGIVGLGEASEWAIAEMEEVGDRLTRLRERLWDGVAGRIAGVRRNGGPVHTLPNTLNVSFEYIDGETVVLGLDAQGIAVSTGSACTSDVLDPSHVLIAMGLEPAIAQGAVRFSLGREHTAAHVDRVVEALTGVVRALQMASAWPSLELGG